jgi:drug/metabolite transporter (DMT)-like permease
VSRPLDPSARARCGYAGIVLSAASWGTWSFFLRRAGAGQSVASVLCSLVVMSTIALLLCPLALRATRRRSEPRVRSEWVLLGVFGVTDALNCGLFFSALATTSVAVAVLTHYLAPLFVAIGAPLLLGEPRRPGTLPAVLLGLSGLTLVEPMTALALAVFLWREPLDVLGLAGGAAILMAAYRVVREAPAPRLPRAVLMPPSG